MLTSVDVLRQSIDKIVKILTSSNLRVTQRGSSAFVEHGRDGKINRVNIPCIADDSSEELIAAIQGFIDHEVSHVLHSDFGLLRKSTQGPKGGYAGQLHNIIEDTYIERAMEGYLKGSFHNLNNTRRFFLRDFTDKALQKALSNNEDPTGILAVPAFRAWAGQVIMQEYMEGKWHLIGDFAKAMGQDLIDRVPLCKNTQDTYDLTMEIVERCASPPIEQDQSAPRQGQPGDSGEESEGESPNESENDESEGDESEGDQQRQNKGEEKEKEEGKSKGESDEEGEPDEGEDEGESDEGEDEGESDEGSKDDKGESESDEGEGEGESDEGEGDSKDGDSKGGDPKDGDGDSEDGDGDSKEGDKSENKVDCIEVDAFDLKSAMHTSSDFDEGCEMIINNLSKGSAKSATYLPFTTDYDVIEVWNPHDSYSSPSMIQQVANMESRVDSTLGPLKNALIRAIKAKSAARWSGGLRSGKVSGRSLNKLAIGHSHPSIFTDRVFKKKHETVTNDVAITLMIDCSASMSRAGGSRDPNPHTKAVVAMDTAFALSSVLTSLNITHEILGFTDNKLPDSVLRELVNDPCAGFFSRYASLYLPIFKPFEGKLDAQVKYRMAAYPSRGTMNSNIDGESILIAARRLAQRKEAAKLMIVLSDGQPVSYGDKVSIYHHLQVAAKMIEATTNIGLVGIGIKSDKVKQFYKNNLVIHAVSDLGGAVLNQIRDTVIKSIHAG